MFKNIIIAILATIVVFYWLSNDPDELSNDPDDVTIEYKCSILKEYSHVPTEVNQECKKRGKLEYDPDVSDPSEGQKVSRSFL